jgi:hypothetical protein
MTKLDNPYEAAFAAYLQSQGAPHVSVNETRRSRAGDIALKNLDTIVSPIGQSTRWLIDIKGRRFPGGTKRNRYWTNWSSSDDLRSMSNWESLFGAPFRGLLLFAYCVDGDVSPLPQSELFAYRGKRFAFLGISLTLYLSAARLLSPKWRTYGLPTTRFRQLATPFSQLLQNADEHVRQLEMDSTLANSPILPLV